MNVLGYRHFTVILTAFGLLLCNPWTASCQAASFFTQEPSQAPPASPSNPERPTPPAVHELPVPSQKAVDTDKTPPQRFLQESAPGPPPLETKAKAGRLSQFVDKWIEAKRRGNPDRIASFYGNNVHFYNAMHSRADIANENMRFLKRWPEVSYTRIGEIRCLGACSGSPLTVEVLVVYETKSFERNKCSIGTARQQFILEETDDVLGYSIIGESQNIIEKRNNFDMSNGICPR